MTALQQSISNLIHRWDNFLRQVEELFLKTLEDATPRLISIIDEQPADTQQLLVSWGAIKSQLISLIAKPGQVFQDTLSPRLEELGYSDESIGYDRGRESSKQHQQEQKLHELLEQEEHRIMGICAEIYYTQTLESAQLQLRCSRCVSPIEVQSNIFRAHYEKCSYCNTINTYEPSAQLRGVEWFTLNHLATWRCYDAYLKLRDFQRRMVDMHAPLPGPFLEAMETVHRDYYRSFLRERIRIVPELEVHYEADMERYMDEFYALKERHSAR